MSENKAYDRTCIDQLPEECHWEIHCGCLKPYSDELAAGIFKQNCCGKTHKRTHKSNRCHGDCKDLAERMTVSEINHTCSAHESKLGYNKEVKDESNRTHDHKLMKCGEKNFI